MDEGGTMQKVSKQLMNLYQIAKNQGYDSD